MASPFTYRPDRSLTVTSAAELQAGVDLKSGLGTSGSSVMKLLREHPARAVLIVLQAVNAGGKDGTIEALRESEELPSHRVERLKRPVNPLADHNLLRLAVSLLPQPGELVIFNRSYYEDLVYAARHQSPDFPRLCSAVLLFEDELTASGTRIVKLHLHIDKVEQRRRLAARRHPHLRHLFNPWDYHDQEIWPEMMQAYDAVLAATHTSQNPWFIIPANQRDFRNHAVVRVLRDTLGGGPKEPVE
jgi:polyphosphate kinase 2 (PPK2 family)